MEWLIENWHLLITLGVLIFMCTSKFTDWFNKPTEMQVSTLKSWLLYAVTMAEQKYKSGTGKLKLSMVYDMAISKFKWLSFIPFETFCNWVDDALVEMREILSTNENINTIVMEKTEE